MANSATRLLITGATGFIGSHLINHLTGSPYHIRAVSRHAGSWSSDTIEPVVIPGLSAETNWDQALEQCEVVIHTAARVHILKEHEADPLAAFRKVNVAGTLQLAQAAAKMGVKRFIFLSSIAVNGTAQWENVHFSADDHPQFSPHDYYAQSKYEAELALSALAKKTSMEVVIIRPPLVYGPGAKGHFPLIVKWIEKGLPLPLKLIHNQRSFVSIYNLIDLVRCCITHPQAANEIFLVSDDEDVSTVALLQKISILIKKPLRLLPVPYWALQALGKLTGKENTIRRLCGSLQINVTKTKEFLNWQPPYTIEQSLQKFINLHHEG